MKTIYLVIENGNGLIHQAFESHEEAVLFMNDLMSVKDHEDFVIESISLKEISK
jgi:hypothetical protein